jgi:hypothetical protein
MYRVAALANLFGYDLDLLADPDSNSFPEFFTVHGHSAAPRTSAVAPQVTAGHASSRVISQVSPWSRQSKRTSPLSWPAIMFSITRVPNPRCVGGVTVGPPNSIQRKTSRPSAVHDQAISTRSVVTKSGYTWRIRIGADRNPMEQAKWSSASFGPGSADSAGTQWS